MSLTPVTPETDPPLVERLRAIGPKIGMRGWPWFKSRLRDEFRKPTTPPGLFLRRINAGLWSITMTVIAAPVRLFCASRQSVTLFYDLEVSPITFDFCFAQVNAELLRIRHGLRRVDVVIVPGPEGGLRREDDDYEEEVDRERRRWRLDNIVIPLCRMMPSIASITICRNRIQAGILRALFARVVYPIGYWPTFPLSHQPNHLLDAARAGQVVRPFCASEQGMRFVRNWLGRFTPCRPVVTITLRGYGYMPARNSNLKAWVAFARMIEAEGFRAVFIPDTEAPPELPPELQDFAVCTEAAWNLGLRMALYQSSWLNMMVSNGPFALVAFSDAPYLLFKIITPSVRMTSESYMRKIGYDIDVPPPYVGPYQRWVWEDDDLPVLIREFAAMRLELEQRDAQATLPKSGRRN